MALGAIGPIPGSTSPGGVQVINVQRPGANISGAGFRTVASFTVLGGLLGRRNIIRWLAAVQQTSGVGQMTARFSYGGTVVATFGVTQPQLPIYGELWGEGVENSQRGFIMGAGTNSYNIGAAIAINSTVDQTLLVEMDLATDADIYVCRLFQAELLREP